MLLRNARGDAVLQSKSLEFCSSAAVVPQSKFTELCTSTAVVPQSKSTEFCSLAAVVPQSKSTVISDIRYHIVHKLINILCRIRLIARLGSLKDPFIAQ